MSQGYQVAPIFLIRMAGAPFDVVEQLATTKTSKAARELIVRQTDYAAAKIAMEKELASQRKKLTKEDFLAWKKTMRTETGTSSHVPGAYARCFEAGAALATSQTWFEETLQYELKTARTALLSAARDIVSRYLVFSDPGMRNRLNAESSQRDPPPRNKQARAHERHMLLYLQRLCAKNDSLSEFGPSGWGTAEEQQRDFHLAPTPEITRRETFLERWTAHAAAAAINADPEVRPELSPRLHPNGRLTNTDFVFVENGKSVALDQRRIDLLRKCDGNTPAYSLGDLELLAELADQRMVAWALEVRALEAHAFEVLLDAISRWRPSAVRQRWIDRLSGIAKLPARFAAESDTGERAQIMDEAGARLEDLGTEHKTATRFLYSATNPIGEECFRECGCSINPEIINQVAAEAAPWIDLWRDNYAFVASRVAAGLRNIFDQASPNHAPIPLPAFLRLCSDAKLSLSGPGLVSLAAMAFHEVKTAFRERMKPHAGKAEHSLTADDCHFIRQNFKYDKFDEYTYPSADLQIAAKSVESVGAGDYQWILAELHPPAALLHHGFFWSCPDKPALGEALAATTFGRPNFHFGFFAADFTATTVVHLFDLPGDISWFAAPQRGNPKWNAVRPADAEVYIDPATGDVCLRKIDNQRFLGSFARNWIIPLGFHPFNFSLGVSTPRFRCGNVIVQRRSWSVRQEELGPGDFTGISRDLVLAVERLRAAKDWPRYVFIRPTEQVLRRSGAEGRDKDTKPVFVDLESYLFLEIFHRWLTKAGELEVTEMLPTPDDLLWREPDGRRTFEFRTQIIPS